MSCRFSVLRLSVGLSALLLAIGVQAAPARKHAPARLAAEPVSGDLEVELDHQLGEAKGAQLRKLVERFNAQSAQGKVVVSDRRWGQGSLPHMTIVSEQDEDSFLNGQARYKPLWQVMKEAGVALNVSAPPKVMVPAPVDNANRLLALPVALSSPVVFYNKDLLDKLGVSGAELPKTWRAWVGVLGRVHTQGVSCPMTASQPVFTLFENAGVWNNQPLTITGKNELFAANGLVHVKHMAMMASWVKSGYLRYFGRGNDAEAQFASGKCGVIVAPSSAYPELIRQAGFAVGVAPYPYHDDAYGAPLHTLADGPALWVANNKTPAEYKLVARFIQFWLQADNQAEWQLNAGYLPLSRAGLPATQSALFKDETVANRQVLAQLNNKPASRLSAATAFSHRIGVRRILAEEMEQVFADKKPPKQGLDDAVQRIRLGEGGCCRNGKM